MNESTDHCLCDFLGGGEGEGRTAVMNGVSLDGRDAREGVGGVGQRLARGGREGEDGGRETQRQVLGIHLQRESESERGEEED